MTVPLQSPISNITAALGQTVFPFGFRCDDSAWLVVLVNNIQQAGAAYVIALNADQKASPGGTVTFGVAPGAGKAVVIERVSPAQQTVLFTSYGPFPARSVEAALDRIVMLLQEVGITRPSLTPVPVPAVPGTLVVEDVPAQVPNSTDGTDGLAAYTTAHAPLAGTLKVFVDGVRQPPNRYALVGSTYTFIAGYHPTTGSYVCAEYYY